VLGSYSLDFLPVTTHPTERLYELAERLLDAQERDVNNLRARMPAAAAAAAVAATLLVTPGADARHPTGPLELSAFTLGIAGVSAVIAGLMGVLWSRDLAFTVSPSAISIEARARRLDDDPQGFDVAMAQTLEGIAQENAPTIRIIHRWFGLSLIGLVIEVVGFGTAAGLAS
jgi:hypothetical protein